MQKLILSLTLLSSLAAEAFTVKMEAVVRTPKHKAKIETVQLKDLISETTFDGEYFKIVKGKGDEAVSFHADKEILLKASSAYHHLTIARDFFVQKLNSEYVKNIPKMIIRIEHTNQFSELGHFAHDNLEPQFNNALTVPAGKGLASRNVKPWGMEIWFRPTKRVNLKDLNVNDLQAKQFKMLLNGFRNQVHMQSLSRFLSTAATSLVSEGNGANPFSLESIVRTAGSSVIMEAGYLFIDPLSKALARQWYWLDTALVPEIIYHEYSHAALSDSLVLSHSTAIIEGMADFFAGQIANSPKLAKSIKKYNTFNGKNAKRKQTYMIQFEQGEYANTDFVFGLLWELKKVVGEEKGSAFMYDLRKNLNTNSSIRNGLVDGIVKTCETNCESFFNDRIRILKALNLRGI